MLGNIHSILKLLRFDILYHKLKILLPRNIRDRAGASSKKNNIPLISVRELQPKFESACRILTDKLGANNIGEYLEFGVCEGTSLACMFHALASLELNHVRLFGFDSFEGLPAIAAIDIENELQPGECASNLASTEDLLTREGVDWHRTFLIKGWFNETLNDTITREHNIKKASLIMIDCDLYSSAKESLKFCRPLIKDTAIFFFGDWNEDKSIGEKRAFEEFLQENPQLKSELLDRYKNNGIPKGRIFLVTDTNIKSNSPIGKHA